MRFDPTLIVTRLVVERQRAVVYDERFHEGVNIIRGENSSGKSTVLNFIYYGLGGDLYEWSGVALLCTRVYAEVSLNGKRATLGRDISQERGQPMDIFGGDYEMSKDAPANQWLRYPYARSQSKESFSQALFRLLEIPEVAGDQSGNVTIHQLLRLLYADQLSPVDSLFRFERFDPPALRDTVGRLLCGAYDSELYNNDLTLRALQKEFEGASAELSSLLAVAGQASQPLTPEWLTAERHVLNEQRTNLQAQIAVAERELFVSAKSSELSLRAQRDAYAKTQSAQSELETTRQKRDALELTIADSATFILGLERKIAALNDSALVAEHIGEVRFQTCPACYMPIDDSKISADACHLCKTPFNSEQAKVRIVALVNDAAVQLKQSTFLQSRRLQEVSALNMSIEKLEQQWQEAARRLSELSAIPTSDARNLVRSLTRQAGYLDRKLENLEETARIIGLVDELSQKKSRISDQMSRLRDRNEALRTSQQRRLSQAYVAIEDEIRNLLKHDLRRQDSFENPDKIEFDFAANRITVDGQAYFSASSRVILKSSFFLGFFAAATKQRFFRHPRFCMLDTIEDKGMEPQRSHNFQHQIEQISNACDVEHQIIFATAMISPELDDEQHTVGRYSTRDEPTLAIAI